MDAQRKKTIRRWALRMAVVLLIAWISLLGFVNWAMRQPPEVFGRVMAKMPMPAFFLLPLETLWMQARKGNIGVGDPAPDFTVKTLDERTPVELGSLWATKPVVLVFGSYT